MASESRGSTLGCCKMKGGNHLSNEEKRRPGNPRDQQLPELQRGPERAAAHTQPPGQSRSTTPRRAASSHLCFLSFIAVPGWLTQPFSGPPVIWSHLTCIFVLSSSLGTCQGKVSKYTHAETSSLPPRRWWARQDDKTHTQHALMGRRKGRGVCRNRTSSPLPRNHYVSGLLLGGPTVRDPTLTTVTLPHEVHKYTRHLNKGELSDPSPTAGPRPHSLSSTELMGRRFRPKKVISGVSVFQTRTPMNLGLESCMLAWIAKVRTLEKGLHQCPVHGPAPQWAGARPG